MKTIFNVLKGLWSLVVGLGITGKEFFRPWLTVQYPRKEVVNLGSYRGHIDLVGRNDDLSVARCIVCGRCQEICPSSCIKIEFHVIGDNPIPDAAELSLGLNVIIPQSVPKAPVRDKIVRVLDGFRLNYNYCSLCGLCVQNCPVQSLEFSRDSYLAGQARRQFEFDLLERLKDHAGSSNQTKAAA